MSYWDIRKSAQLNHLPAPDPEMEKAGVKDNDPRLARSRSWLERYHAEKAKTEKRRHEKTEERRHAIGEHADASGEDGEAAGGEAPADAGGADAS